MKTDYLMSFWVAHSANLEGLDEARGGGLDPSGGWVGFGFVWGGGGVRSRLVPSCKATGSTVFAGVRGVPSAFPFLPPSPVPRWRPGSKGRGPAGLLREAPERPRLPSEASLLSALVCCAKPPGGRSGAVYKICHYRLPSHNKRAENTHLAGKGCGRPGNPEPGFPDGTEGKTNFASGCSPPRGEGRKGFPRERWRRCNPARPPPPPSVRACHFLAFQNPISSPPPR